MPAVLENDMPFGRIGCVGLVVGALVAGCSRHSEESPAPPSAASATPKGTLDIGERITQPLVPLAEIAKNPGAYSSRLVATTGKVTAVCQEMGCWMELQDDSGRAHVRMHGHNFFVPKTASGHVARVQATVVAGATEEDCAEKSQLAKVQLDATGVELD
jgi:hypothetical protein